jgi:beta-lactam-binding protein with PASTA domain
VRHFALPPAFFSPGAAAPADPAPTPTAVAAVDGRVPDVVGTGFGRASAELSAAGYAVSTVRQCDPTGNSDPGDVWRQNPPGGSQAAQNSSVTIWYGSSDC